MMVSWKRRPDIGERGTCSAIVGQRSGVCSGRTGTSCVQCRGSCSVVVVFM